MDKLLKRSNRTHTECHVLPVAALKTIYEVQVPCVGITDWNVLI